MDINISTLEILIITLLILLLKMLPQIIHVIISKSDFLKQAERLNKNLETVNSKPQKLETLDYSG